MVLASPVSGEPVAFATGEVGWLYPAPGGVLYAPDLVRGKTTVLDVTRTRLLDTLEGVTMPWFGSSPDRYVVVAGDVMLFSYPDRALVRKVAAEITNPWVVEQTKDQRFVFVLERRPGGSGDCQLVAVDLITGEVSYRRRLSGDVSDISLSLDLSLMTLVDRTAKAVRLVTPGGLAPAHVFPTGVDTPVGADFLGDGSWLAIAVADEDGAGGKLSITRLKKKKGTMKPELKEMVSLEQTPVGLAVGPGGEHVAVAHDNGDILIFTRKKAELVRSVNIGEAPKHLVWCDSDAPGPLMPEWSEKRNDLLEMEKKQLERERK